MHLFSLYRNHNHCWFLLEISSTYYAYYDLSLVIRKPIVCICENKDTDQLRSNCVADQRIFFATQFYQNPKFHASSHLRWLYSLLCVGPGRKPRRPVFSQRGSFNPTYDLQILAYRLVPGCVLCHSPLPQNQEEQFSATGEKQIMVKLLRRNAQTSLGVANTLISFNTWRVCFNL